MRVELNEGQKINIFNYDNIGNKYEHEFYIIKVVGYGASCIVYDAYYYDVQSSKHMVRLKEYYPVKSNVGRDINGSLIIDDKDNNFIEGLSRFEEAYKKHASIQLSDSFVNITTNVQGLFEGNSTKYMVINYNNGVTYEKAEFNSVNDILKSALALTKAVGKYHDMGLLHLDIKPANILTIPESKELIMLFDFDSVQEKSNIQSGDIENLSYSEKWAAPEQLQYDFRRISEETDIYAIGAVIFNRIMGRYVEFMDRRIYATWSYNKEDRLFKDVNPETFTLLTELFHKTLSSSTIKRFHTTKELQKLLEKLVNVTKPSRCFLKTNLPKELSYFVGRDNELSEIKNIILNEEDVLFLRGIGGIGKSEIVKNFARDNYEIFTSIVFARYTDSIKSMIISDSEVPISNFNKGINESDDDYFIRKMKKLHDISNKNILFIVDNFDVEDDEYLDKLLRCNFKFIFTTRNDFCSLGYKQINILEISDVNKINNIFYNYYKKEVNDKDKVAILKIINLVGRHTMTVELIAKQMMMSRIKPVDMLNKLSNLGLTNLAKEKIKHRKDSKLNNKAISEHIYALFNLSKTSYIQKRILIDLSFIPHIGIDIEKFKEMSNLDSFEDINYLIDLGWVRINDCDVISLHPVIADVIRTKVDYNYEEVESFIDNLVDYLQIDSNTTNNEKSLKIKYGEHLLKYIDIDLEVYRYLYYNISFLYSNSGNYNKALEFCYKTIELFNDKCNEDYRDVVFNIYNNLGTIYCELNQYNDALKIFKDLDNFIDNNFKDVPLRKGENLNDIGYIYMNTDKVEKGIEYTKRALDIYIEELGEKNNDVVVILNNIAFGYSKLDNVKMQKEYYLKALEILNSIDNKKGTVAVVEGNLGCLYEKEKNYFEALKHQEKALDIRKELYGDIHPDVALSLKEIASVFIELGRFEDAEENILQALEVCKKVFDEDNLRTADCYNLLGLLYYKLDKSEKSLEYLDKVLKIRVKYLGEDHPSVRKTYCNIQRVKDEID